MKKTFRKLSLLIAIFMALPVLGFTGVAMAEPVSGMGGYSAPITIAAVDGVSDVCQGIGAASGSGGGCSDSAGTSLGGLLRNIISVMSILIGAIAIIMIIVGGFKYVTSGGDTNQTNSAKNTIVYALIGLVVAALAQVLAHFVLTTAAK